IRARKTARKRSALEATQPGAPTGPPVRLVQQIGYRQHHRVGTGGRNRLRLPARGPIGLAYVAGEQLEAHPRAFLDAPEAFRRLVGPAVGHEYANGSSDHKQSEQQCNHQLDEGEPGRSRPLPVTWRMQAHSWLTVL